MSSSMLDAASPPAVALQPGGLLLVGEAPHGTAEVPRALGALLRHATSNGVAVRLGLEVHHQQTASLEAYIRSSGGPSSRRTLLRHEHWRLRDGRASCALLELLELVRSLHTEGADVQAFGCDEAVQHPQRSSLMASAAERHIAAARRANPNVAVLILVGSSHARLADGSGADAPMGARLKRSHPELRALLVRHSGGTAFAYMRTGRGALRHGVHRIDGTGEVLLRAASEEPDGGAAETEAEPAARQAVWDGTLDVGELSASPPAAAPGEERCAVG